MPRKLLTDEEKRARLQALRKKRRASEKSPYKEVGVSSQKLHTDHTSKSPMLEEHSTGRRVPPKTPFDESFEG